MKRFFQSLFGVSRKELNGLIFLSLLFLMSLVYPAVHRLFSPGMKPTSEEDARILDSLVLMATQIDSARFSPSEQFVFDPNIAEYEDFLSLGFSERTASQIINYRKSGGSFKTKKDLFRIYSIDTSLVKSLYSYIDLPEQPQSYRVTKLPVKEVGIEEPSQTTTKAVSIPEKFNLNQADTSILQTVTGIGTVLSKRIVSFREKLGGFIDNSQLYEVYNLDSTAIDNLLLSSYLNENPEIRVLKINLFDETDIGDHPYVTKKQARLIVAFRNQHGFYNSIDDLGKVYLVDANLLNKLAPYLSFEISE